MHERLIEGWLDSASERSYQVPFCQMLVRQGYTVLHSTRHSQIEFGKDVIAIAPDGVPCAYQLKGNPGSRLTLDQYREIQEQLIQLATQKLVYPGLPDVAAHRSYLVTNGLVDEEVHRSIDDLNRRFAHIPGTRIEIISRGKLLADAHELGASLWPSELKDINLLLEMLVEPGDSLLPIQHVHKMLTPILALDPRQSARPRKPELKRRVTSAAVLVGVALRSFSAKSNHYAILSAWVLFSVYVVGSCTRHDVAIDREVKNALRIAADAVFDELATLCDELAARTHFSEGNAVLDMFVYRGRMTLLVGLMSVYWFWGNERDAISAEQAEFLEKFISGTSEVDLWGEGAIPQILANLWYARSTDATIRPDYLVSRLLSEVVQANRNENTALPGPYYHFEDVCRRRYKALLGEAADPLQNYSFAGRSSYAHSLFSLLVRTNLKVECRDQWPDLSKVTHEEFVPAQPWQFCVWHTPFGTERSTIPIPTRHWSEAVATAQDVATPNVPSWLTLRENRHLLLLYIFICPHRGLPEVVRRLGAWYGRGWHDQP